MKQVGLVMLGLLAGLLLAGALLVVTRIPAGTPVTLEEPPTQQPIEVHVIGAVLRPGLYRLTDGSRVQDAITAAGGLAAAADLGALNLAARLEDGQQLAIPYLGGVAPTAGPIQGFRVIPGPATQTSGNDLMNINTASAAELSALPEIGPTIAQRIVDYRSSHGPFSHIEDIMNVAGIGPATFDNIKDVISVQ